jgi:UMP-CMP kinase
VNPRVACSIDTEPAFEVTFVLGGPGAGKGTQCALITENYGLCHLSAGDLLREERNSGSKLADMINSYIKEGKIVPAEVTIRLLKQAMEKSGKTKFLIDGFPRNVENLSEWLRVRPESPTKQEKKYSDTSHKKPGVLMDTAQSRPVICVRSYGNL